MVSLKASQVNKKIKKADGGEVEGRWEEGMGGEGGGKTGQDGKK